MKKTKKSLRIRRMLFVLFGLALIATVGVLTNQWKEKQTWLEKPLKPEWLRCEDPEGMAFLKSTEYQEIVKKFKPVANPYEKPIEIDWSKVHYWKMVDKGVASWYSRRFCLGCNKHLIMANGEVLRDDRYTIAHNHIPLNTKVLVKNTQNGKCVEAVVTDRGGFEKYKRVADLSKAVAEKIGCKGLCQVEIWKGGK